MYWIRHIAPKISFLLQALLIGLLGYQYLLREDFGSYLPFWISELALMVLQLISALLLLIALRYYTKVFKRLFMAYGLAILGGVAVYLLAWTSISDESLVQWIFFGLPLLVGVYFFTLNAMSAFAWGAGKQLE